MKTLNMKVIEELFYTGQYEVDRVPKHHVMISWMWTGGMKVQLCALWTLLVCGGGNFVSAAVTVGSIGWLTLRSAADKDKNSCPC
jgi:hypothetical protein